MRYNPKALVTGATGFVGSHVATALASKGWEVRRTGRGAAAKGPFVRANLTVQRDCEAVVDGVQTVVHCAGLAHRFGSQPSVTELQRSNVLTTDRLLAAAQRAGVEHFILTSSSSVYGAGQSGSTESVEPTPDTPYARSKYDAEQLARRRCEHSAMGLTIVRPATVFGVGDPGNVRRLIESVILDRFFWIGRGDNRKSLVSVEDVAACITTLASEVPKMATIYNLAAPSLPMKEVVDSIAKAAHLPSPKWRAPGEATRQATRLCSLLFGGAGPVARVHRSVEKWLSEDTIDASKFEAHIRDAVWRQFDDAIRHEVDWVKSKLSSSRVA